MKAILHAVLTLMTLLISASALATEYTFEVGTEPTWAPSGTSSTTATAVTVRSYVPGSSTTTYRNVTIYTPTYTSDANALGDTVGTVYSIYGTGNTAWVNLSGIGKSTVIYPISEIMHTQLFAINDQRFAIGTYYLLGGVGKGFMYDAIYDQYATIQYPGAAGWSTLIDINNAGRMIGMHSEDGGYTRSSYTYDCLNGYQNFVIPGATWTIAQQIDDQGNIYGYMNGIPDAGYFIAHPVTQDDLSVCQLFPRDDIPPPITFGNPFTFELGGDTAVVVRVADFDGGGVDDLLIYHEPGVTILYTGESSFDQRVTYADNITTLFPAVADPTQWDFNNDGIYDKPIKNNYSVQLSKPDGSFYYVPQVLPTGGPKAFGDFNGDGLIDVVVFAGAWATIYYQIPDTAPATDPAPAPTTGGSGSTTTTTTTTTTTSGDVPAISPDAQQVELERTVDVVNTSNVVLTSGQTLWISADTAITYNDSAGFAVGQNIQFKAWENPDGALIAISVELP